MASLLLVDIGGKKSPTSCKPMQRRRTRACDEQPKHVANIISKMASDAPGLLLCEFHDSQHAATWRCDTCGGIMCDEVADVHCRLRSTKSHHVVALSSAAIAATLNCRYANRVIVKAPRRNLEVFKVRIHHRKKCSLTIFKVSTFDVSFQFVSS